MLVLSGVLFLLLAGSVAAADETAPVVDVPEDIPGADVLVEIGDTYNFDASASTDDVGIVKYVWEFNDGVDDVMLTSTNGLQSYAFMNYVQTWVIVHAFDAAGNEGLGFFCLDIVEVVSGDLDFTDTSAEINHSYMVEDGDVNIENSRLSFLDGAGNAKAPGGGGGLPDQFSESLTPGGDMSGSWHPYYYYSYGDDGQYGHVELDEDTKLSGDASIRVTGGNYRYGFEYIFDSAQNLEEYNTMTFWFHSDYSTYPYYANVYFYGNSGSYSGYMYNYNYGYGYYCSYYGWMGMSISLDYNNVDRWYTSGMYDLTRITHIRFYTYGYSYARSIWLDHVGFSMVENYGDDITESTVPGGDFSGRWSASNGISTSSHAYVGSTSVYTYMSSSTYHTISYTFDSPQDFSAYNGMRMFTYYTGYYYLYWYAYQFYVEFANGGYAYYYMYGTAYMNYYVSYYYGDWDMISVPWGPTCGSASYYNMDWTQVRSFSFINVYPSSYSGYLYIDGLEWTSVGGAGGPKVTLPTDTVPLAIYNTGGDTTINRGSVVSGAGKIGARVVTMDGTATFQDATFDNIWTSQTTASRNSLGVYGGIEVFGDATIDHVKFTNCLGPGLSLYDGSYTLDPDTIDLTGTGLKLKLSPKIIFGVTGRTTGQYSLDITGWTAEDSSSGTGILLMVADTDASIDVDIHENMLDGNSYAAIVISNLGGGMYSMLQAGPTADLDVTIRDQVISNSGTYGIIYYAGDGDYAPNVWTNLLVDNVTVGRSGKDGLLVQLDAGCTNLKAVYRDSVFTRNSGSGITHEFGFFGKAEIEMYNVTSEENSENGLTVRTMMAPFVDGAGNVISPVANVDILINGSLINSNSGWGVLESLNGDEDPSGGVAPPWAWNGPTMTTLWYNMTVEESLISANAGGGWLAMPEDEWSYADLVATRWITGMTGTPTIEDNRGPAMYIGPNHYMAGGQGMVYDIFWLKDCFLSANFQGIYHYLGAGNTGYYSEIHVEDSVFEDNSGPAIAVTGSWTTDSFRRWGLSMVRGCMVYVDGCTIDSPVIFELEGADDTGGADWEAMMGVQFTDNSVDSDEPVKIILSAYPSCQNMLAWGLISHNSYLRPYPDDGMEVTMYGGLNLDIDLTISNQRIVNPLGSGIDLKAGTLTQTAGAHQITGKVLVDRVTIIDAAYNGINFTIDHKVRIGAKSRCLLEIHDSEISGALVGIKGSDLMGLVYHTSISGVTSRAVDLKYATFDFYSCDIGEISTTNVKVLNKGAARMWFDLKVDVHWAGGTRVLGAVVEVQDNTWSTIGIDTVDADAVLGLGYVNSYTILPDTVYSKNPFVISATYLGLTTAQEVNVNSDRVIDLVLVDDVLPRLTVNKPMDGTKQTKRTIEVVGSAWDMHSGLDRVELSIDGFNWFTTTADPMFEYTFTDVPEGNLVLTVRAIDLAENANERMLTVMVDATPPSLMIIEPGTDEFDTSDPMLDIVGVTELGAYVAVNGQQLTLDHTLFSTTVYLTEGYNEVRVLATDRLGNRAVQVLKVTLDTIAPPIIITAPMTGTVQGDETVTVTGQTEAGAMVYVNGKMVANQNGTFTTAVTLDEGTNEITAIATDAVGNSRSDMVSVVLDTTDPWLRMASPMEGDVFGSGGILVRGWVEAGSIVQVNDRLMAVNNGYFSADILGTEGGNTLFVTVTDLAGNSITETVQVFYDTMSPSIDVTSPSNGYLTRDATVTISGMLGWDDREGFRDISLVINGEFAPFTANGEFSIQYELVEGTNPLIITTSDDVGNSRTINLVVVRDTKAPFLLAEATPTFMHKTWNKPTTYNPLVYIEGTSERWAMVTVDGSEVVVDEDGNFNVSVLLDPVPEGTDLVQKSITIIAQDLAGNSKQLTIDVYRLAPEEEATDYETAQWFVLFLSIVILVVAIVAAVFLWRRVGMRTGEGYDTELQPEEM